MIKLKLRCPKCGKHREWLSYKTKSKGDLFGRQASCFVCGTKFTVKGIRGDNIVSVLEFSGRI